MIRFVIRIFDYMASHKWVCMLSWGIITLVLVFSLTRLNYKEDISDFLPVDGQEKAALSVYQDISGADRIFAVFRLRTDTLEASPETFIDAISLYDEIIQRTDTMHWVKELTTQVELEQYAALMGEVYAQIPYFLTEKDYQRMDSLLKQKDYVRRQLVADKEMLMFPSSSLMVESISRDPLNLFTPVLDDLQKLNPTTSFETYDGYIFTPQMRQALVMLSSPFGNSETQHNALLMEYLAEVADSVSVSYPDISVHYVGGPVIAVGNARQIKTDSIWSVSIAVILILMLLGYSLRRFSHLLLIAVSICWGWIFAMGMLSFVHDSISLIVVGISSIILGIAINYPLHLIAHLSATPDVRSALREVASPLIIGNITTVGAFLALVPLDAVALRDLGLFSTFLLIGTILFVILYLPHVMCRRRMAKTQSEAERLPFRWLSNLSIEAKPWMLPAILLLTFVLGYFSTFTYFDANMANINYITDEQRQDLEYFQRLATADDAHLQEVYVVSRGTTLEEALAYQEAIQDTLSAFIRPSDGEKLQSSSRFFSSEAEQQKRLSRWKDFVECHRRVLFDEFGQASREEGFSEEAFTPYLSLLEVDYVGVIPLASHPLASLFARYLSVDSVVSSYQVVDRMNVTPGRMKELENRVRSVGEDFEGQSASPYYAFDIQSMNSALVNHLSENFNYIGWACSIIVFLFLWFSFGRIELALLSFLPMAVSWVWILGIMGMCDIHFNIVNIILATFIFGQGDDYTIFITEGCCYEYAYRKRLLASYKSSIITSALIMFIGIGTLIFAKHPALHSLAQVTIIGMSSVVLMAFTLPPLIFNWMVKQNGNYRYRPLTLPALLRTLYCSVIWLAQLGVGYLVGGLLAIFGRANPLRQTFLNKFVSWVHRLDQHLIPGVHYTLRNPQGEDFSKPAIIVCNHQSMMDPMCLMALSHKILIVANTHSSHNPVIRLIFRWLGFYTINQKNFKAWQDSSLERDIDVFRKYVEKGYSIAVFPEGMRNPSSSILRYHKGAFYLAHELGVDILPVIIHGMNNIMPLHSFASHPGKLTVCIESRITPSNPLWGSTHAETTRQVHRFFVEKYGAICKELEDSSYYRKFVLERYMYKGADVYRTVKSRMREYGNYACWVDNLDPDISTVYIVGSGLGEFSLLMALVNPRVSVIGIEPDAEKRTLAFHSAEEIAPNLSYREIFDNFEDVNGNPAIRVYHTSNLVNR